MALRCVTAYNSLKRKDPDGNFRSYFPLRAVGLALESGYKLCQQGSLGLVKQDDLQEVRVAGELQVLENRVWQTVPAVSLRLRSQDAALALKLLTTQRELSNGGLQS